MIDFPIVDSHVHVWDTTRFTYPWLGDEPRLNRPYLLPDFDEACGPIQVDKLVFVQAECEFSQGWQETENWTQEDLKPYIDEVLECFGAERVMYGGDWPVALLATGYPRWVETLQWAIQGSSDEECRRIFRDNSIEFYGLSSGRDAM